MACWYCPSNFVRVFPSGTASITVFINPAWVSMRQTCTLPNILIYCLYYFFPTLLGLIWARFRTSLPPTTQSLALSWVSPILPLQHPPRLACQSPAKSETYRYNEENKYISTLSNPNPLGILAGNLPESSQILEGALLETCPYHQNAPCIFVDLSYLTLMTCTFCQVLILPHLKRWKYQFPTVLIFFSPNKMPLGGFFEDLGWLGLRHVSTTPTTPGQPPTNPAENRACTSWSRRHWYKDEYFNEACTYVFTVCLEVCTR